MTILPEHILNKLSPEDRKSLGKAGQTSAEAQAKFEERSEKKIHETVTQWLRLNGYQFVHARMDKQSTIAKGWPDLTVIREGRCVCVELKCKGGVVSKEQRETIAALIAGGTPATVAYSAEEAIEFIKKHLTPSKSTGLK